MGIKAGDHAYALHKLPRKACHPTEPRKFLCLDGYEVYAEMVLTFVGKWFRINSCRSSFFCALSISIPTKLP